MKEEADQQQKTPGPCHLIKTAKEFDQIKEVYHKELGQCETFKLDKSILEGHPAFVFTCEGLEKYKNLKTLDMSGCGISCENIGLIPKSVAFTTLDLSRNELHALPPLSRLRASLTVKLEHTSLSKIYIFEWAYLLYCKNLSLKIGGNCLVPTTKDPSHVFSGLGEFDLIMIECVDRVLRREGERLADYLSGYITEKGLELLRSKESGLTSESVMLSASAAGLARIDDTIKAKIAQIEDILSPLRIQSHPKLTQSQLKACLARAVAFKKNKKEAELKEEDFPAHLHGESTFLDDMYGSTLWNMMEQLLRLPAESINPRCIRASVPKGMETLVMAVDIYDALCIDPKGLNPCITLFLVAAQWLGHVCGWNQITSSSALALAIWAVREEAFRCSFFAYTEEEKGILRHAISAEMAAVFEAKKEPPPLSKSSAEAVRELRDSKTHLLMLMSVLSRVLHDKVQALICNYYIAITVIFHGHPPLALDDPGKEGEQGSAAKISDEFNRHGYALTFPRSEPTPLESSKSNPRPAATKAWRAVAILAKLAAALLALLIIAGTIIVASSIR